MSNLALKLIADAKRTNATRLDLGNCGLTELPNALFELTRLEELILSNEWYEYSFEKKSWERFESQNKGKSNNIKSLNSKIILLNKLKTLIISHLWKNNYTWDKSNLIPLNTLKQLKKLDISNNNLSESDIASLKDLKLLHQLNIHNTQLSNLTSLKDLKLLQQLNIHNTQVSDLTPLKDLKQLQQLNIHNTQVSDLMPLKDLKQLEQLDIHSTLVNDLAPLNDLKQLQQLYIHNTKVIDLTPLKALEKLQFLNISSTEMSDLTPLKYLNQLQHLVVSFTLVHDLMPLRQLTNLQFLNISSTQVSDLTPLKELNQLQHLAAFYTKVIDLMPLKELSTLQRLEVGSSPIINPPIEIVREGIEAIRNYFKQIETQGGTEELYEAKMIIVGEGGTGKTTLFQKLKEPILPIGNTSETHGINIYEGLEIHHTDLEGQIFHANLWDFGGQELQYMTHQFFLTPNALYVLMMDSRNESPNLPYWFKIISLLGKDPLRPNNKVKLLLVFNKRKGSTGKPPQYQTILDYYEDYLEADYIELDLAESGRQWDSLKDKIDSGLINLPIVKSQLPKQWRPIREALRKESQKKDYIAIDRYAEICAEYGVKEEAAQLLLSSYLHQLGSLLHFQDDSDLLDLVILKPDWAVEGVYTFLKDDSIKDKNGKFTTKDIFSILKSKGYTTSDAQKILKLMSKNNFDICYASKTDKDKYVAAQLLPDAPPPQYKWHTHTGALQFRYQYPIMPKGLMSRLIVRLSEYFEVIDETEIVWKKGTVLNIKKDKQECRVMMKEDDEESPSGLRQIIIEVMGDIHARKYALRIVRDEVDSLHEKWFRNIKVDEMVPCCCSECLNSKTPQLYKLNNLLKLREKGLNIPVRCFESAEEVSTQRLMEGVYDKDEISNNNPHKSKHAND